MFAHSFDIFRRLRPECQSSWPLSIFHAMLMLLAFRPCDSQGGSGSFWVAIHEHRVLKTLGTSLRLFKARCNDCASARIPQRVFETAIKKLGMDLAETSLIVPSNISREICTEFILRSQVFALSWLPAWILWQFGPQFLISWYNIWTILNTCERCPCQGF